MSEAPSGKSDGQSRSFNLISSWPDCPLVAPEVLREWLTEEVARSESELNDILGRIEGIRQQNNADNLQAGSIMINGFDFRELAKVAEPLLGDDVDPRISMAFTAGLRLGLVHERLTEIRSGRFKRAWDAEDRCEHMRGMKEVAVQDNQAERCTSAIQAIEWAKGQFPTAAADGSHDFLMEKAAEHLGISRRTLNRRLGGK